MWSELLVLFMTYCHLASLITSLEYIFMYIVSDWYIQPYVYTYNYVLYMLPMLPCPEALDRMRGTLSYLPCAPSLVFLACMLRIHFL